MSSATTARKIDDLLGEADESLAQQQYFEAERLAMCALPMARQMSDFARMAKIVEPLKAARLGRLQLAVDVGTVTILPAPFTEGDEIEPGCYVVQPTMVGADGRRFRLAALARDVPVAIVCHEPITDLGLCPLVALGSGGVIRTKSDPPSDLDHPDLAWFVEAMQTLGDWAVQSMDMQLAPLRFIDELISRLDAVPEHAGLHECLQDACRNEAEAQSAPDAPKPKAKS